MLAGDIAKMFRAAGFRTGTEYMSGLKYRYITSGKARPLLPIYHLIDSVIFSPGFMSPLRPFVLSFGEKP